MMLGVYVRLVTLFEGMAGPINMQNQLQLIINSSFQRRPSQTKWICSFEISVAVIGWG